MIKIWAVQMTDTENKITSDTLYFGNYAQANRYAHHKSKASPLVVSRVLELEVEIFNEKQVAFHIGNAKFSLDKGSANGG